MKEHGTKLWLVNTGWNGTGKRMSIKHTRALLTAALDGSLNNVTFVKDPVFGVEIPSECPNVPTEVLTPKNTWEDKAKFDAKANDLAKRFNENFKKYESEVSAEVKAVAPLVK